MDNEIGDRERAEKLTERILERLAHLEVKLASIELQIRYIQAQQISV